MVNLTNSGSRWAALYDSPYQEIKADIIDLARRVLLRTNSTPEPILPVSDASLAVLRQRLPIKFHSRGEFSNAVKEELWQVQGHLRVFLRFTNDFEITTVTQSEPILSEAAYTVMTNGAFRFDASLTLQSAAHDILDRGQRIEQFIVLLLLILARDSVVRRQEIAMEPSLAPPVRHISLIDFMTSLFPHDAEQVLASRGWDIAATGVQSHERTFAETFRDSRVYFNHFTRVDDELSLGIDTLIALCSRGAGVAFEGSRTGFDAVLVYVDGDCLQREHAGTLLIQAIDDDTIQFEDDCGPLFDDMDPRRYVYDSSTNLKPKPIIRLVFDLAAAEPSLKIVKPSHLGNANGAGFTTFDFICSGLAPRRPGPVQEEDQATWRSMVVGERRKPKYASQSDKQVGIYW